MHRTSIFLESWQIEALDQEAERLDTTSSAIIRRAIDEYFARQQQTQPERKPPEKPKHNAK